MKNHQHGGNTQSYPEIAPTLEPAQPLSLEFLESLVRSPAGSSTAEVLPENVLAKGDRMIVCGRRRAGRYASPRQCTAVSISDWERGFYESAFTYANVDRLTRCPAGFEGLWSDLAGKGTAFPVKTLIQLPQTLAEFVRGDRGYCV